MVKNTHWQDLHHEGNADLAYDIFGKNLKYAKTLYFLLFEQRNRKKEMQKALNKRRSLEANKGKI